jgi:MFS family permease
VTAVSVENPIASPLNPSVRRLFIGIALSALGSGLTMPFLYVYLSSVRDIETQTVGLLLAWMGILGFASAPVAGTLIDNLGPRPVILGGLLIEAVGVSALGLVASTFDAFIVGSIITVGGVSVWPATNALLTRLVPQEQRERVYGVQFMLLNAGLGIGGLVSSVLVSVDNVASFQRLYLIDGFTYLGFIVVVFTLPKTIGQYVKDEDPSGVKGEEPGWREVLQDRTLIRLVATSILVITFGYAQFEAGFAAYAVDVAEIKPNLLGWAFAANTGAIVLGQMVTLKLIKGRRRSRLLALCAAIWSSAWVIIALSGITSGWLSVAAIVIGLGVFGIGETLWAPIAPAVVNDLAKEELRGRYNALQGMTWTVSSIIGPGLAGMLIGNGFIGVWVGCTVGGTALAALLFLNLGRHLTPAQNGLVTD